MRVAVTGASGFIGAHALAALEQAGFEAIALSRRQPSFAGEWRRIDDICSPEARAAAAQADVIVHLAALSDASLSLSDPQLYVRVNTLGTVNMLEAAREHGAFFILASSQRVYRPGPRPLRESAAKRPTDPYGYSKLAAEMFLRMYRDLYGVRGVTLRFFSVYGPGQGLPGGTSGVVSILLHRALRKEPIWVDADKRRDLTYVEDVARGILLAVEQRRALRPVYNVATGIGTPLAELARHVIELTGSRSALTLRPADRHNDDLVADITRARKDLGYEPRTDLATGLRKTLEWINATR